jgi:hypothetical protein
MKEIIKHTPENFEREYAMDSALPVPTRGALRALAGNAGAEPKEVEIVEPEFSPGFRTDNLPADIADGIKAAHIFFNFFEKRCPGEYRDFALAMVALSRLRGEDYEPIPDEQIADLMNLTRKTVREKREGFFDWQDKSDLGLIDFKSQDRDPVTLKYKSNLYRVSLIKYVAHFVGIARERMTGNPRFIIENSVETGLKELHEQVCSTIPNAEIVRRAKAKRLKERTESKSKTAKAREKEDKLVEAFEKFCAEHSEDLRPVLESLYERFNQIVAKYMGGDGG